MRFLHCLLAFFVLAAVVPAQTPAQLKRELRTMESAAKKDPDALVEAAKWAREKGLVRDARRIFNNVLKQDPNHAGANEALGNEQVDGVWMTAKAAQDARAKARAAEYKAKGMVEVDGAWVEKGQVDDAKRGVFHFDGDRVTKDEYELLSTDYVRHPVTGQIIARKDLSKAEAREFPVGDRQSPRWVSESDADRFHADPEKPWVYRTHYATILSTAPIKMLEELRTHGDRGYERVKPLLGTIELAPGARPVIFLASTQDEFRQFGSQWGDETSAYGIFLAQEEVLLEMPMHEPVRPIVAMLEKDWAPYYIRHASAVGYLNRVMQAAGTQLPLWFIHGVGSLASRFDNGRDAGWFGQQHAKKGGVRNLQAWFNSFAINGEMESSELDYNIYQAGLVLSFAMEGGDSESTEALQAVTAALQAGKAKAISKSVQDFQSVISTKEAELKAYLAEVIKKGP